MPIPRPRAPRPFARSWLDLVGSRQLAPGALALVLSPHGQPRAAALNATTTARKAFCTAARWNFSDRAITLDRAAGIVHPGPDGGRSPDRHCGERIERGGEPGLESIECRRRPSGSARRRRSAWWRISATRPASLPGLSGAASIASASARSAWAAVDPRFGCGRTREVLDGGGGGGHPAGEGAGVTRPERRRRPCEPALATARHQDGVGHGAERPQHRPDLLRLRQLRVEFVERRARG